MRITLLSIPLAFVAQKMQHEAFSLSFRRSSSNISFLTTVPRRNRCRLKSFWNQQSRNRRWHSGTRFLRFCGTSVRRRSVACVFLEMFRTSAIVTRISRTTSRKRWDLLLNFRTHPHDLTMSLILSAVVDLWIQQTGRPSNLHQTLHLLFHGWPWSRCTRSTLLRRVDAGLWKRSNRLGFDEGRPFDGKLRRRLAEYRDFADFRSRDPLPSQWRNVTINSVACQSHSSSFSINSVSGGLCRWRRSLCAATIWNFVPFTSWFDDLVNNFYLKRFFIECQRQFLSIAVCFVLWTGTAKVKLWGCSRGNPGRGSKRLAFRFGFVIWIAAFARISYQLFSVFNRSPLVWAITESFSTLIASFCETTMRRNVSVWFLICYRLKSLSITVHRFIP